MASAGRWPITGSGAEPRAGSRENPWSWGRGRVPEVNSLCAFRCSKKGKIWLLRMDFSVLFKVVQWSIFGHEDKKQSVSATNLSTGADVGKWVNIYSIYSWFIT